MQWLVALETDNDLIATCRLMNIFRRKGLKVLALSMASRPEGSSLFAVLDSPESDIDHIFNFLRRTEGVQQVTYYRHDVPGEASFVFVEEESDKSGVWRILQTFSGTKLIFAIHRKYLLEIPAESASRWAASGFGGPEFLRFTRVKTTRGIPQPELVGTLSER